MRAFALAFALALTSTSAFAHAQLENSNPPVGGSVPPTSEVRLHFSEGVEPSFSSVSLKAANGSEAPHGKPTVDPADNSVLIVKTAKPLAPGVYTVTWKAVSVDTHHTQGTFQFTITP